MHQVEFVQFLLREISLNRGKFGVGIQRNGAGERKGMIVEVGHACLIHKEAFGGSLPQNKTRYLLRSFVRKARNSP